MEDKLNNLIKTLKDQKMTELEKSAMRVKLKDFMKHHPIQANVPVSHPSPYFSSLFFTSALAAASILLVLIGVGGFSYMLGRNNQDSPVQVATQNTPEIPGEQINEPVNSNLARN